ncbi:MAG: class I mannose-6-phosphate isomerase [Flavobacteriaceae bacterium]|nr:class I mannose-6-phosphate isomerase [Flavobacteriaceae bacterium]
MKWYPIKFHAIPKEKIWGGKKLSKLFHKDFSGDTVGESWEISGVENNVSIVANGDLKEMTLTEIVSQFKSDLVGNKIYDHFGNDFPLLIKFIDANKDLSVQLHPNDDLAKQRHNSFGKTEMWYIMQAEANSRLVLGFTDGITPETYQEYLKKNELTSILNNVPVTAGDTFFIPTGTVHAIGAGIVLAEIQQTSDITYRVYDWDRLDSRGQSRALHQEEALEAINFDYRGEQVTYTSEENKPNTMISCDYFTTNSLNVTQSLDVDYSTLDSFVIYMCVSGSVQIQSENFLETLICGESVLIPASLNRFTLHSENAKLLEVFI